MIAMNNERNASESDWQTNFANMLPDIQACLRIAFRRLGPEARDDAMGEAVAHCLLAYVRLHERGRMEVASAASLAWYSSRQVKCGRPAVGRMNACEPLSRYAQLGNAIQLEQQHSQWIDSLVEDKRATVADQVAARMDVAAWFGTLTEQLKAIAKDLAFGCSTSEVANKYGVTSGRISQLRRSLEESWGAFQRDATAMA